MPITVIVRSGDAEDARLTFDGTQRVVIGRGAGSDIRLPDKSVSHRHASLRASGGDFVLVDEGSTNGTFVGLERVAPHTSRPVRSGDTVRVGRLSLVLQIDHGPSTRDVAGATRDLALALVARAMAAGGTDRSPRVRVAEGADAGSVLVLAQEDHDYVVGRAAHCDLPLADVDTSREHTAVARRNGVVVVRDLGAKNGTWLAGGRLAATQEVPWRASQLVQVGRTVLVLEEPLGLALAELESAPDEVFVPPAASLSPAAALSAASPASPHSGIGPVSTPKPAPGNRPFLAIRWSPADIAVMGAALCILVASLIGLLWLLRR
jgi:pSer/pThr/pTyr-binding forkhead associated (FHA) protein